MRSATPIRIACRRSDPSARCRITRENGLVSDGDPAVAFGPAPGPGGFSYANGSRLYYANLTSALPGHAAVQGVRGDRRVPHGRRRGCRRGRWQRVERSGHRLEAELCPVLRQGAGVGRQRGLEPVLRQRVRVLRGLPRRSRAFAAPVRHHVHGTVATAGSRSRSRRRRTTPSARTASADPVARSGPTRHGVVYVFDYQFAFDPRRRRRPDPDDQVLRRRRHMVPSRTNLFTVLDGCALFEPSIARCVMDGVGGARDDLMPDPSRRYRQRRAHGCGCHEPDRPGRPRSRRR